VKKSNPRRNHFIDERAHPPTFGTLLPDKRAMEEAQLHSCPECDRHAGRHGPRCSRSLLNAAPIAAKRT